ncbi:MAG: FAD-dependent monooxygenase [Acaryochloris sp. SU_5_25]|nr:FAD-dependent monooxygenase [Acaryochloris sp. SU_5_25]
MKDENGSISPRQVYDVLIVGAGPVGLATALGLRKRGITNILVIDQTREFRKVGQGVDLLPNGLRALKYIGSDAYEKIKEPAVKALQPPDSQEPSNSPDEVKEKPALPKRLWRQKNIQGDTTRSFPTDFQSWFDRYGEGRVSVSWFDLQTTLRSLLPPDRVQANHRCINLEEEAGRVRIDTISNTATSTNPFAHWEMRQSNVDTSGSTQESQGSDPESYYAKLVVAADGINSTIRQVLYDNKGLKEWAKPHYSGFSAISSRIDNVPNSIIEELDNKYLQGERIITVHNNSGQLNLPELKLLRLMLIYLPDNSVSYLLYAPFSLNAWQNKSLTEILDSGTQALRNAKFPTIFTELIGLSNPEKLSHRLFYMHPVNTQNNFQPPWSHGRVILVGDAAHAMPPFMAQGANQGFEDAAVIVTFIAKLLQENGLDKENAIANIFEKYEKIRRPFIEKIQTATMESNQWAQQQWDDFNEILHRRVYPSVVTLGE